MLQRLPTAAFFLFGASLTSATAQAVNRTRGGVKWCALPNTMLEHLQSWHKGEKSELTLPLLHIIQCTHTIHALLIATCESLYLPLLRRGLLAPIAAPALAEQSWRSVVKSWNVEQRTLLLGWAANHKDCSEPQEVVARLRPSAFFLEGLSGQFSMLARDVQGVVLSDVSLLDVTIAGRSLPQISAARVSGMINAWLWRFQSAWQLALNFAVVLQYVSLDAFDHVNYIAYNLHKGTFLREFDAGGDFFWQAISNSLPLFMLDGGNPDPNLVSAMPTHDFKSIAARDRRAPLRHDRTAGDAVLSAVRARQRLRSQTDAFAANRSAMEVVRPTRFLEVGVYRANLSGDVWDRAVRGKGPLEIHLVDHWGHAGQPISKRPRVLDALDVGTGSNMGGQSNESTLRGVWRRFVQRGARCIEVPHWQGLISGDSSTPSSSSSTVFEGLASAPPKARADVFFHRTSTVLAAKAFQDASLDVVYIDGDHKWWSVLQDLTAWWPKVSPGGALIGHDFHLNDLMECEGSAGGTSNDVPLAVAAFFRAQTPIQVTIHTGFAWSVLKPVSIGGGEEEGGSSGVGVSAAELCKFLRERMAPHWHFEICLL